EGWLESRTGSRKAFLTNSCTAALEIAVILADIQPGDEVIMPSFTFVSTANAVVLRGGIPVFVDIRPDTLNLDESKIKQAITSKTRAIIPVHYAGVSCDLDAIAIIAQEHNLVVIEDAAQGIMASYNKRPLGSLGQMAAVSFHETKNLQSGEGGALLLNDKALIERAEAIREKGTNRSRFFRGQVDKYTWVDIGSSYLPSELVAAFLWGQMGAADEITKRRVTIWEKYHSAFVDLEKAGIARRPIIPDGCSHNGHIYYLLLPDLVKRTAFIDRMREAGIGTVFHYVPLHTSSAGMRYGRSNSSLEVTIDISERVVRLPVWLGIEPHLDYVIHHANKVVERACLEFS
ncbi:MAG: dTDP-4-amino-4,6-dideoxygalactose transaminase, partial [Candidatus Aquicultorales bacterium]